VEDANEEEVVALDDVEHLEAEFFVEQSLIGWLIGTAGATVKEVEREFQVAISVDQGTKALGYSKVKVKGEASMVQKAAEHMNASLAVATQNSYNGATEVGPFLTDVPPVNAKPQHQGSAIQSWGTPQVKEEAMQIDQTWVGWLLGKGGGVAREIETITGAKVSINQSTKSLGYSTVKVSGAPEAVEDAKVRISASLERMLGNPPSEHYISTAAPSGGNTSVRVKVEQQWVGWLVGKSGAVVKEIEDATGAKVSMNQDTKAMGYSTCTITGPTQAVEQASMQVSDKLRQVDPSFAGLEAA